MDSSTLLINVAVDTGGTFTDIVARRSDGKSAEVKVPSTPHNPGEAILNGLVTLQRILPGKVSHLAHGTTVATNALLENKGARVVFITNAGFEDLLYLRRQDRPSIYQLSPSPRTPLIPRAQVLGVEGRLDFKGQEIGPLECLDAFIVRNKNLLEAADSLGVCLLHAYANPVHEQAIGRALSQRFPDKPITLSSVLSPLSREYERAETVAANAFVAPVMTTYIQKLQDEIAPAKLSIMDSAGGRLKVRDAIEQPVRTALSGPAGGVRGAWDTGLQAGVDRILGLDIGGTSTDVSIAQGELRPQVDGQVGQIPLRTPMLSIETVGAGGGSIAKIDTGGALRVGPESAGALPGPAAYGNAGPDAAATVTDANVVLGRIENLLGGSMTLDKSAAHAAVERLATRLQSTVTDTAKAIVAIAEANMIRACKNLCMAQGVDPRELALVAFGGAGGLHGCAVAQELGCKTVLFPEHSGVLSALGIQTAPVQSSLSKSRYTHSDAFDAHSLLEELRDSLETLQASSEIKTPDAVLIYLDCRLAGQSHDVPLSLHEISLATDPSPSSSSIDPISRIVPDDFKSLLQGYFAKRHKELYGWMPSKSDAFEITAFRIYLSEPSLSKPVEQADLSTETHIGPIAISRYSATLWLPDGWQATKAVNGTLVCQQNDSRGDPITEGASRLGLEIHRQRLSSIAEEMGAALMRSSYSANIKERRDFSCALFDGKGNLLIQAAHIPVHLGSQELSVKAALENIEFKAGDTVILNDPFCGGTHLPDVTLISAVFLPGHSEALFFVANRAHHADVGGISPGSMPAPFSADGTKRKLTIHDEGFRIGPTLLTDTIRDDFVKASRTPDERMGDLRAQEAANHVGIRRLQELAGGLVSLESVLSLNNELLRYAEFRMRQVIQAIPDGEHQFTDALDSDGISDKPLDISVTLTIHGDEATIDFSDSAPACESPLNAVRAITLAASYYVFRCLAPEDLPSSGGIMRPLHVVTTPGSICDAQYPSAVSAGNVETSQRMVDALLGALVQFLPDIIPAASSGSMNNVLFGGFKPEDKKEAWVHYETLAGGCGACATSPGASALHSHMTNTLNTPIEEMERLFPLLMPSYRIREAVLSGDIHPGGSGVERRYQFLAPTTLTLMTERRLLSPYPLAGGTPGLRGRNRLLRRDGTLEELPGKIIYQASPGDTLIIETPCGGGWGSKS